MVYQEKYSENSIAGGWGEAHTDWYFPQWSQGRHGLSLYVLPSHGIKQINTNGSQSLGIRTPGELLSSGQPTAS